MARLHSDYRLLENSDARVIFFELDKMHCSESASISATQGTCRISFLERWMLRCGKVKI